ncbi:MAG: SpoIIE family protein phosphatase [Bacteroidia bacterium]|nr:SpoIIE family protein phosphatase [Bacteroidia bacterium]
MSFRLFNTGFPGINRALLLIMLIVAVNALISYFTIRKNNSEVTHLVSVMNPYLEALDEFNLMTTESKMYATNWVYVQVEEKDKDKLKSIHQTGYPRLKSVLLERVGNIGREGEEQRLKSIMKEFEKLIIAEQLVMVKLSSFDEYEDATRKFQAEDMMESQIIPMADTIRTHLESLIGSNRSFAENKKSEVIASSNSLRITLISVSLALLGAVILGFLFISRSIRKPVLKMKEVVGNLSKGELTEGHLAVSKDVIGEMTGSINILSDNFRKTSEFATEIGKGNFDATFELLGKNDQLGSALMGMKESLKAYSEDLESQVAERTRELLEKSAKLELAYGEIRDSIQYAKHIQEAILPSRELIDRIFRQSFIFYKPKDIVSGDFYWFAQREDEVVVAIVDCTGHGVPGALMTVIGSSLLNQIVNIMGITEPGLVLRNLDEKVIETLKQQGGNFSNDGMDLALFRYNLSSGKMEFAGAKRSLFHFTATDVKEIKGDKFPIGSTQYGDQKRFTTQPVNIREGDVIYMFSDGYQDQFGGMAGKKFMLKRFKEMLKEIYRMKMPDQLLVLEQENAQWTGNSEQTDDILVMGIRF